MYLGQLRVVGRRLVELGKQRWLSRVTGGDGLRQDRVELDWVHLGLMGGPERGGVRIMVIERSECAAWPGAARLLLEPYHSTIYDGKHASLTWSRTIADR